MVDLGVDLIIDAGGSISCAGEIEVPHSLALEDTVLARDCALIYKLTSPRRYAAFGDSANTTHGNLRMCSRSLYNESSRCTSSDASSVSIDRPRPCLGQVSWL